MCLVHKDCLDNFYCEVNVWKCIHCSDLCKPERKEPKECSERCPDFHLTSNAETNHPSSTMTPMKISEEQNGLVPFLIVAILLIVICSILAIVVIVILVKKCRYKSPQSKHRGQFQPLPNKNPGFVLTPESNCQREKLHNINMVTVPQVRDCRIAKLQQQNMAIGIDKASEATHPVKTVPTQPSHVHLREKADFSVINENQPHPYNKNTCENPENLSGHVMTDKSNVPAILVHTNLPVQVENIQQTPNPDHITHDGSSDKEQNISSRKRELLDVINLRYNQSMEASLSEDTALKTVLRSQQSGTALQIEEPRFRFDIAPETKPVQDDPTDGRGRVHPNRMIYDVLKGIDWVQGYYSEGQSIDVFVDFNFISADIAMIELMARTGAQKEKFNLKQSDYTYS